jgi:hypothetical protein
MAELELIGLRNAAASPQAFQQMLTDAIANAFDKS